MKNLYFTLLMTLLLFTACQDDDDPSRTEMLSRTWVFSEVVHTTSTNGFATANPVDITDSDYEMEFRTNGSLEIRNDGQTLTGTWEFFNDFTLDDIPNTINPTTIVELTENLLWTTNTTTTETNGVVSTIVSEVKMVPKR